MTTPSGTIRRIWVFLFGGCLHEWEPWNRTAGVWLQHRFCVKCGIKGERAI